MPNADEIRRSLEGRIAELEPELQKLKAAHAALMAGAGMLPADQAPRGGTRRVDPTVGEGDGVEIPRAVVGIFERWDAHGRPAQAAAVWQRERWLAALPGEARVLETLPDRLDRSIVRQLVLDKPGTAQGMFEAMIIVYAWGGRLRPLALLVRRPPSGWVCGGWDQRCWPRVTR